MRVLYEEKFRIQLKNFPEEIREKLHKQVEYLVNNIRHPSLRAKKFDESGDVWQARVDKNVRFYFKIEDNKYKLLRIIKHPK